MPGIYTFPVLYLCWARNVFSHKYFSPLSENYVQNLNIKYTYLLFLFLN